LATSSQGRWRVPRIGGRRQVAMAGSSLGELGAHARAFAQSDMSPSQGGGSAAAPWQLPLQGHMFDISSENDSVVIPMDDGGNDTASDHVAQLAV
jgi:hypothetical protein